jgi:molybdate transport system permease protein
MPRSATSLGWRCAPRGLGEFGATLAVAGGMPGRTQTSPLAVYDAMRRNDYDLANQIAVVMVVIGYATTRLTQRLEAEEGK